MYGQCIEEGKPAEKKEAEKTVKRTTNTSCSAVYVHRTSAHERQEITNEQTRTRERRAEILRTKQCVHILYASKHRATHNILSVPSGLRLFYLTM